MIYITGDTHGLFDRFFEDSFPEGKSLSKEDVVIITGDFGGVWDYGEENDYESAWLDWLDQRNWTTLFIDGNHEDFPRIENYPVIQRYGAPVHRIRDSVCHLMRGYVYTIQNRTFFTLGGARSHNCAVVDPKDPDMKSKIEEYHKQGVSFIRTKGKDWWPEEIPSEEECRAALNSLSLYGNKVDYIITHECPVEIATQLNPEYGDYPFSRFLSSLEKTVTYQHWYFGHYHRDSDFDQKHTLLFYEIRKIKED